VTTQGQVIRTPIKTVSKLGRATQGVTLIRMHEGDRVASVTALKEPEGDAITQEELEIDEAAPEAA
jgi:DNA gyrase subunit A